MKRKTMMAGLLSLAMATTLASSALAAQYSKTVTLGSGQMGNIFNENLTVGDNITLTLVNPTNRTLTFETSEQLGPEKRWTVAPNSHKVVNFAYTTPFSDDVQYMVMDESGTLMEEGALISIGEQPIIGRDTFRRTITLQPGMSQFSIDSLGVGDRIELTLVNPTDQPLVFETTQRLGAEKRWVVQPGSQQVISYTYTSPFSDEVRYQVLEGTGAVISQGTLLPAGDDAMTAGGMTQQQSTVSQQTTVESMQQPTVSEPQPEIRSSVRGYW